MSGIQPVYVIQKQYITGEGGQVQSPGRSAGLFFDQNVLVQWKFSKKNPFKLRKVIRFRVIRVMLKFIKSDI